MSRASWVFCWQWRPFSRRTAPVPHSLSPGGETVRGRRFRIPWLRRIKRSGRSRQLWLSVALGLTMAFLLIRWFDAALRPQLVALSEAQVRNHLTQLANRSVAQALTAQELSYGNMVTLQATGSLSTLATDTVELNHLRTMVLEDIVTQLETTDSKSLGVPLGALTGIDLLSALGPRLPVRVVSVASAEGLYQNDFISAGINQTLHRIMLDITLNTKLLLPGGVVDVAISTPVCVAETVIIGQVPQTYLQWSP